MPLFLDLSFHFVGGFVCSSSVSTLDAAAVVRAFAAGSTTILSSGGSWTETGDSWTESGDFPGCSGPLKD